MVMTAISESLQDTFVARGEHRRRMAVSPAYRAGWLAGDRRDR
jgi:hypothetical protein